MSKASSWVTRVCGEWRGYLIAAKTRKRRAVRTRRVSFEPLEPRLPLATITVTSLADNMIVDGQVTLREAIEAANTNTSVDGSAAGDVANRLDEIVFQPGLSGKLDLNGTELTVTERLTIVGPGRDLLTIDARELSRHFRVTANTTTLTLDGLTLTRGKVAGNGGAVFSEGLAVVIENSAIRESTAADGGAVYGTTVNITASLISKNHASGSGGAIYSGSLSLFNPGSVMIASSAIYGNTADVNGGAVHATGRVGVYFDNSTISGNRSGGNGGGIAVDAGEVTVLRSTVVDNHAGDTTGSGGGIYHPDHAEAQVAARDSLIAQNTAAFAPDLTVATSPGPLSLRLISYSLIGNNAGTYLTAGLIPTVLGLYNIVGEPGAVIDPKLGMLKNNGGATLTHALLHDSPAIDAGFETQAGELGSPLVDQRGFPRVENGRIDIGAFELTQPIKIDDDGTTALWANNPTGFVEPPVPIFLNGTAVGNQPYQVIELYQRVPGTDSYPLVFVDLVANTFSRLAYMRPDGAKVNFGTSTVGSASFRTSDQVFHYVPTVTRADVTTGGSNRYQSVVVANFGGRAKVTSTKSFLPPVVGQSSTAVGVEFETLQDITLATGANFRNNDRLRLFTASSMFNDETHFDADVLRYEDAAGNIQTLVLKDNTPTNAFLFPSAIEIGSWFELVKTDNSVWFSDSPTLRVTINNKHGLRLGLQGYLQQSTDNNDDSLSVWLEWLDAPNTIATGTKLNLDTTVTATAPGTPGVVVSESDGNTVVSEFGTTDTFTVALAAQPRANVVIDVSSSNTAEAAVSPASLIFTPANWNQPQSITVIGVPDSQIDTDQISTVTLQINAAGSAIEYRSVAARTVSVTTTNIDQPESPTITWNAPNDITYGTLLGDTQLNATASVPGTFVYAPASGALLNAGTSQRLSVTFTPDDSVHYRQATAFVLLDVLKAESTISWSVPADIVFGNALNATQLNAMANVPGTFVYSPTPGTLLDAGDAQQLTVMFTPNDSANYNTATFSVLINVQKADPVLTWNAPTEITYGTLLDETQLSATASVPGTFVYTPASGVRLNAGADQTLSVTFTPTDTLNYNEVTTNVTIDILKADPVITWNKPADIIFGSLLSETQLNATSDVAGIFTYAPAIGTQLGAGTGQQLSVGFVPTDTANYNSIIANASIDVLKAIPEVDWNNPTGIEFGTLLSDAQLNATTIIAGTFVYSPAAGTRLNAGADQSLQVTFTPTDTVNFQTVTKTVTIDVAPAESFITWDVPADITVGTPLSSTQLNAMGDQPGSFVYVPAIGTRLSAGNAQPLSVTFTPDAPNFASTSALRLINVLKVNPVVTWNRPADIRFGTLLDATQLNATADVPGTFVYSPPSGTLLNAGANQQLSATFTPTDATNFNIVTKSVTINVMSANLDFGDAPAAYPVTLTQDGARHSVGSLRLGSAIDIDADGEPTADATGDGTDDDGVFVAGSMVATSAAATKSSFTIVSSGTGKLDAWIDFNQDGDWNDAGEQIFTSLDVVAGANVLSFNIPTGATPDTTAARFRLSSAGGLTPTGAAADGEVEDYIVTIADGDAAGGAAVEINATAPGTLDVLADGNDVVVRSGTIELFRAPGDKLKRLDIRGTNGDDTLNLANLDAIFAGLVAGDAGSGHDTLRLTGSGQSLDLTQLADSDLQGLETIDITGDGNNSLTLDVNAVLNLSSITDTLRVLHDSGDVVNYKAGWSVDIPQIIANQFVHILKQAGATIEVVNATPFQNPFRALDTNRDGNISPLDALVMINRLNTAGPGPLATPTSAAGLGEFYYIDTNGDRSISPIDVLQVVNFLNGPTSGSEGEFTDLRVGKDFMALADSSSVVVDAVQARRQDVPSLSLRAVSTVVRPQAPVGISATTARQTASTRPTNADEDANLFSAIDAFFASSQLVRTIVYTVRG